MFLKVTNFIMKFLFVSILVVVLSGCATNKTPNFSSISIGMNKEQIMKLNGKPYRTAAIDGLEYFIYRGFDLKLMFDGDKQGSGSYEAFIRFKDNKVEAYGRLDDFDSTKHKELLI